MSQGHPQCQVCWIKKGYLLLMKLQKNSRGFQVFCVPGDVPAWHEGEQEQRDHYPWLGLQHCQGYGALCLQWQVLKGLKNTFLILDCLIVFDCRVSDLPDKSDLLLSAADKYDIRFAYYLWLSTWGFSSTTTKILLLLYGLWMFPPIRDLKEECCQSLSTNLAVDQVIFSFMIWIFCWRVNSIVMDFFCIGGGHSGPLRLTQGCWVESHSYIISTCPQRGGLQPTWLEN